MEIHLQRKPHPAGTNGIISYRGEKVCETIELPWRDNKKNVSCIPNGKYRLIRRDHIKHGIQLEVMRVPNREAILIHPANFAMRELQGCIAPVTKCTGPGQGEYSKAALKRLQDLVYPAIDAGEAVYLVIYDESTASSSG